MNTTTYPVNQAQQFGTSDTVAVAGANLGFGFCKLVLDGRDHTFMSALTPVNPGVEGLASRKPLRENVVMGDDGKLYEAGVDGVLAATEEPLKVLSRDWARSKHYKLLMGAALNRMAATGKRRWIVVTGLAADHFKDAEYRADVLKLWKGLHGKHVTPFGDIEIVEVQVIPETAGGFLTLLNDKYLNGLIRAGSNGVILDFGRMTVNWLPFRGEQTDGNRFSSVDVGVSNVISEATKLVRLDARQPNLHPLDVEAAMMGLRPIHKIVEGIGGKKEMRAVSTDIPVSKALIEVWPRIEQAISNALGDMRGKLLIGIGGGAQLFEPMLRETYKQSTVEIAPHAQMANAQGMYSLGRQLAIAKGYGVGA
ncbi:ParM/StbA family protein [Curvibacter sp. APW13]|uniref:ParM/StbA family protein n=1 Tax=Curvibacter sp. APW13 TaxID=3077236 RepID=UPI0028E0424B|nr:ParM/StbA family protein [Curvibacter sp. APW13]MDT8992882.1 ParM/StbA family protein [Curvibacter sp. APW13]